MLNKDKQKESATQNGVEKEIQSYLIKEHKFISKWISGPFLLDVRDSVMQLSPKYLMDNIDYDDPEGLLKDFHDFYTNAILVLEKKEVKLSVIVPMSPIIYFKWCNDDKLIWGFDSLFFKSDEVISLLVYKEANKYVDPQLILHGILQNREKMIRNERNADSQTVLFFLYLWCYFIQDAHAIALQFKHETGFFYRLRSQENFYDIIVKLLFFKRIQNLHKIENQKNTEDFLDLDVRKEVPIEQYLLLQKKLEDAIDYKTDWPFGDLLDLAIFCHDSYEKGKFSTFRDACKAAAKQWRIAGQEITYDKIEKSWENYYQKTKSR